MSQPVLRECSQQTTVAIDHFLTEMKSGDFMPAIQRLEACETPLEAAQLVLAAYVASNSVVDHINLGLLAEAVGIQDAGGDDDDQLV